MGDLCLLVLNICLRSLVQFYIVSYYIKWVKTSWTYREQNKRLTLIVNKLRKGKGEIEGLSGIESER